jgi:hypothetical protein
VAVVSGDAFYIGSAAGGLNVNADGFYEGGLLTGCGVSEALRASTGYAPLPGRDPRMFSQTQNRRPRGRQGRLVLFNRHLAGLAPISPWC